MSDFLEESNFLPASISYTLRLEGLAVFIASLIFYNYLGESSWKSYFLLFLFPDISFFFYLIGKKTGAVCYNIMHSYTTPLVLSIIFFFLSLNYFYIIVIWVSHIGFDRSLGFGLKYFKGFNYTHLGMIKKELIIKI